MVYKIVGNFSDENFGSILEKISKLCSCIYRNETLFVALNDVRNSEKIEHEFKKIFKPQRDFFIQQITTDNIMKEEQCIIDWCRDNYVRLEEQKYELNNQKKLKQVLADMDAMEAKLQQKLLEKQQKESQRKEEALNE